MAVIRCGGKDYIDGKPVKSSTDSYEQLGLAEMPDGNMDVDVPYDRPDIIDEVTSGTELETFYENNDLQVTSQTILAMLKTKPEEVLQFLLSKQSNAHPLKHGGTGIAYKCEALILATRINLNAYENLLFDIILGKVSSYPEDEVYTVYVSDIEQYLPYKDRRYVNKIFREARQGLFEKGLKIPVPDNNLNLEFHLIGPSAFKGPREITEVDKSSFLAFTLDPIVKALIISSGYTHGAYYRIEWSSRLIGYAKILFFYLEDLKTYKAYPDARPGVIFMTIEQVREILGIPDTYKTGDIKTKILDPAIKKINNIEGIDIYTTVTSKYKAGKLSGYLFEIDSIHEGRLVNKPAEIEEKETSESIEEGILAASGFTQQEVARIMKVYRDNNRDMPFLMEAIVTVNNHAAKEKIANKASYLCAVLANGIVTTKEETPHKKKNGFSNFDQRDYDYDELESMLLNTNPPTK